MKRQTAAAALVAALSVLLCAGCFKINMDVAVAPDLSTSARLAVAVDSSLVKDAKEQMGGFKEQAPKNWKSRQYQDGNWLVTEATGAAGPGESLFGDEKDSPKLEIGAAPRRLSTRYHVSMVSQMPPGLAAPAAGGTGAAGLPDMAGLASAMLADMSFVVTLTAPGEVVATTGRAAGQGKAEWKLAMTDLQGGKMPDFRLTTEIPDWNNIGHLAQQIVLACGPVDAGSRILSALQRGLLPNPPQNAPAAEKLSAADYQRLLEIIGKLDAGAGPAVTEAIVKQSRLNDEAVSSDQIAAAHEKIMKLDIGTIVEQAAIRSLSEGLR